MLLTLEQMLKGEERKRIIVPVPELGGELCLQQPMSGEVYKIKALAKRAGAGEDVEGEFATYVLMTCCVDADGRQLLTKAAAEKMVAALSIQVSERILAEAMKLLTPEKAEGDAGNSEASQSAA